MMSPLCLPRSVPTIAQLLPKPRGGKDTWASLVAWCLSCNNEKGDRMPSEMRWTLRIHPQPPHCSGWLMWGIERALPEWDEFLARVAA